MSASRFPDTMMTILRDPGTEEESPPAVFSDTGLFSTRTYFGGAHVTMATCPVRSDVVDEINDPGAAPHGNFINYYTFNPPENRLSLIPATLLQDLGCSSLQTSLVQDQTSLVQDQTSLVQGQTSLVQGQTALVQGQTSLVQDQTSLVQDQTTLVQDQTSLVQGQTALVQDQTALVQDQTSLVQDQTALVQDQTTLVQDQTTLVQDQTTLILDVGCNSGELSVAFYKHLVQDPGCQEENTGKRKINLLGFDLDEILIQRAQQNNPLPSSISFITLDVTKDTDQLQDYLNQHGCSSFHLCLCLAVTMWVHLNHGDAGLLQLLSRLASISQHLLLEAQPWKCYRSAARRLRKLGRSDFDHFKTLKIRGDVAEHAREHLDRHCGMELIQSFGSTTWDRKLLLFRRR